MLRIGGLEDLVSVAQVRAAIRTDKTCIFTRNRYNQKLYYLIGAAAIFPGFVPKDQDDYFEEVANHYPRMPIDWFLNSRLPAVESAVATMAESDKESENDAGDAVGMVIQHASGIKLIDIDIDRQWTNIVADHAMKCKSHFEFVKSVKKGFELVDYYRCKHCHEILCKHASFPSQQSAMEPLGKRGPKRGELNGLMAVASYSSGMTPSRVEEMCANAGQVCPTKSNLMVMYEKVKDCVLDLSMEALRLNRRRHSVACRNQAGYKGDIQFQDTNGKWHSVARGAIAIDGGGGRRAYQHRICGTTHCLIIFSLVTSEPLYVHVDQISCQRCSITMLKVLRATGKRVSEITPEEVEHKGHCYRNTVRGPATAEEYACFDAGSLLLKCEDSDDFLPDNEAVFADEIISDGDTRGSKKFIAAQVDAIGDVAANIAIQLPDIGHFIKTVSNALYELAEHDTILKGAYLLEASRIRAMSSDLAGHIREFNHTLEMFCNKDPNDLSPNDHHSIDTCRDLCLQRIESIVPHHCGNHRKCDVAYCGFLKIKKRLKAIKKSTGKEFTHDDIVIQYSKESRFQGKYMSMDNASIEKVKKAITSRIDRSNVDRIARVMSSNLCENYFSVLVKFSQGKRLNLGQSDSWAILAHFVVGLRSNKDFSSLVMQQFGVRQSVVRNEGRSRLEKRKEASKRRKQSDNYREQRHVRKIQSAAKMGKEMAKSSAHCSGKLSLKDACKADGHHMGQQEKKRVCSNCHEHGHTVAECAEANYDMLKPKGRTSKRARQTVDSMLLMFPKTSILNG
jgi:hypothetical protein